MTINTARITAQITARQTSSNPWNAEFTPTVQRVIDLTDGTSANQANILYANERAVASASNDDIDLAGSLSDAFGSTITAAEIVAILIINKPKTGSDNTTNLTIGAGTNPWRGVLGGTSPTIGPIKPGGFVMIGCGGADGIGAVTANTADILRVANSSGASATYQIVILARTA